MDGLGGRVDVAARLHELAMLHVAQTPAIVDIIKSSDTTGMGQRHRGVHGIERRGLGNSMHLRRHIPSFFLLGLGWCVCRADLAPTDRDRPLARLEFD